MKPTFEPLFSKSDVKKWVNIFTDRSEEKFITLLKGAGEKFVKYARESGKYDDHTGNLRSSIGYTIVKSGRIIFNDFQKQNVGTEGEEGVAKARQLARHLANTHNSGYVLIGLAGMDYAAAVEAIDGKDVITGAHIQVQEWMRIAVSTVFKRA